MAPSNGKYKPLNHTKCVQIIYLSMGQYQELYNPKIKRPSPKLKIGKGSKQIFIHRR